MRVVIGNGLLLAVLVATGAASDGPAAPRVEGGACPEVRVPDQGAWPIVDGVSESTARVDVDGDGREDRLRLEESHGSGGGLFAVEVTLAEGTKIETEVESSFYQMVTETPVPQELLRPGRECVLALTERLAFGGVAEAPDPSLAWLMAGTKTLRWIEGPPRLPESYTLRVREGAGAKWISYHGAAHGSRFGQKPRPPVVLARRGDRLLLGTFHGVMLANRARTRYAWIYVHPGGDRKLREPSIRGARFVGAKAVILVEPSDLQDPPGEVEVDLTSGRLLTPPAPPEQE
jgi:hypothetical protein